MCLIGVSVRVMHQSDQLSFVVTGSVARCLAQKRPIFRHTSQIFLTVALLRPTKIRFVWQKTTTFLSQTRPR